VVKKTLYIFLFFLAAAFAAGCNPGIVEPPPASISDAKEYMWSDSLSKMDYEIYDQIAKTKTEIQLMLSRQSDFVYVSQYPVLNSSPFYYTTTSGAITLHNLSTSTFFSLPDGYEIAAEETDTLHETTAIGMKKVMALQDGSIVALGEDSLVYRSDNKGLSWSKSTFSRTDGLITAWTKPHAAGSRSIYAGTSTGKIMVSTDNGLSWKFLSQAFTSSAVRAITVSNKGEIFCATNAGSYVVCINSLTGKLTNVNLVIPKLKNVTALAIAESDSNTYDSTIIVGGVAETGIVYWVKGQNNNLPYSAINRGDSLLNVSEFAIAADNTLYAVGSKGSGNTHILASKERGMVWEQVKSNANDMQFIDAPSGSGAYDLIAASEAGNVYASGGGVSDVLYKSTLSPLKIRDIGISSSAIYTATDSGICFSSDGGFAWQRIGPYTIHDSVVKKQGGFVLLPYMKDGITVGTTWDAGSLHKKDTPDSLLVHFKATVITHDDSLSLPNGAGGYKDVFEVEYAPESAGGTVVGSIRVFFTKYDGPILVQSYLGTVLVKQVYRVKK
jgi:photosystem II stability/assembly factor-like uncharacterized protein